MYFDHVVASGGTRKALTETILSSLNDKNVDAGALTAIGCDGTNVNTGKTGGVIRLLEEKFNKPLQWIVCMLRGNELPLRHLFQYLDGTTSGPHGFGGPIGKCLQTCHKLPVCDFEPIEGTVCTLTVIDLSTDQKYLYEMTSAVINGSCPQDLAL